LASQAQAKSGGNMGMAYTDDGWRIFCVDDEAMGQPMRIEETTRFDNRAMAMWRQRNFLHVDMHYGGTVDAKKYAGACTTSISGCNALIIARLEGRRVVECFFGHSVATATEAFTRMAADLLGRNLAHHHAVLVENYTSANSKPKADILLKAGLPAKRLLVYTNPFRQGDQTFGIRFSDGLIGEVHVLAKTATRTEPTQRNDFVKGFDTKPSTKSERELLEIYKPYKGLDAYLMLFAKIDNQNMLGATLYTFDESLQRERIAKHGNALIKDYLARIRTDREFPNIKQILRTAYGEFKFESLR
jgi:hypothetical protein